MVSEATISLLVAFACLQWLGDADIIGYVTSNPLNILACVGAFFILGAVWGVIKWWIYCRDQLEAYNEFRNEFLSRKGLNDTSKVPPEFRREFKEAVERHNSNRYGKDNKIGVPKVSDNKGRIMRWMTFWPVSMIWSLINDFVKRTFRVIYYKIAGFLQSIADKMFSGFKDDLDVPSEETAAEATDGRGRN